jgi:hypothetical protein
LGGGGAVLEGELGVRFSPPVDFSPFSTAKAALSPAAFLFTYLSSQKNKKIKINNNNKRQKTRIRSKFRRG